MLRVLGRTLFALAFVATSTVSAARAEGSSLVGTWRYVTEVDRREDGSPAPVAALSASEGLLIYTADGSMSVNIMPAARSWSAETATADELRETVLNGTAYAGRYRVDAAKGTVTHIRSVALDPEGAVEVVRSYRFEGDRLVLSGTFPYQGETIRFEITWERVSDAAARVGASVEADVEANKALVRSLFDALNRGDLVARNRIVDPRSAFHSATIDRTGNGEPAKSLVDACPMCASLDPRQITVDAMMAEGDLVTVRSTWRGSYTGVLRDVPVAGKEVTVHYTNTYRIADGRIVENWAAYDRLHLLEQLGFGVTPPPASPAP
jgi:hypothetical protein